MEFRAKKSYVKKNVRIYELELNIALHRKVITGYPSPHVVWDLYDGNKKVASTDTSKKAMSSYISYKNAKYEEERIKRQYEDDCRKFQKEADEYENRKKKERERKPPKQEVKTEQWDPYVILGVVRSATLKSIRKAWRKLLTKCHPDKFACKGEDLQKRAEEITKSANRAYQEIVESRK